jgi:glycine dehydrogenase
VCLIPTSAHGTNPASAQMVGMKVVVVASDEKGEVDLADLRRKADEHAKDLAAIMVTYPSTHGVFEPGIVEICDIVHKHGGQVYVDGANLNAMVGLAAPGQFGGDVSHLNLHKTFCIPHGGGGPGVGPVAVRAHLAKFLPGHRHLDNGAHAIGAVSAAPFGSASILPISWMYIVMMGGEGLTRATEVAILNANYIAHAPRAALPGALHGRAGWSRTSASSTCAASRTLGRHGRRRRQAPHRLRLPRADDVVPGGGHADGRADRERVEGELDRFCDAMIAIRDEIRAVEEGRMDQRGQPAASTRRTLGGVVGASRRVDAQVPATASPPTRSPSLRKKRTGVPVGRADNVLRRNRNLLLQAACRWESE